MPNTHEAADELQKLVDSLMENLDRVQLMLEHLELDGTEDTAALKENMRLMQENIKRNEETIAHIRATAE